MRPSTALSCRGAEGRAACSQACASPQLRAHSSGAPETSASTTGLQAWVQQQVQLAGFALVERAAQRAGDDGLHAAPLPVPVPLRHELGGEKGPRRRLGAIPTTGVTEAAAEARLMVS